ncbi:MAG: hypothetical protein ISQ86_14280, partial [Alphaproteobacteria bacterium]|nr:hypothetical protein [Alphaproteobacteria bacterium]
MRHEALRAVPAARREAVAAALRGTFGSRTVDAVTPLSGGASGAMVFRVDGGGTPYMLRAEGTPSPLRNPHQYLSMQIASDAGIAPKLLYLDDAAGVVVTDFVVQRPLADYPGGQGALARAVAEMIRRVQAAPAFPDFTDYSALVSRLFAHVRRTGLFADGLLEAHAERLARLQESDPADPAQA